MNDYFGFAWKNARRIVIMVIGGTIILIGVAGMLLPVIPGFPLVPIGLAVLATEFVWAKLWLTTIKKKSQQVWDGVTGKTHAPPPGSPQGTVEQSNAKIGPDGPMEG